MTERVSSRGVYLQAINNTQRGGAAQTNIPEQIALQPEVLCVCVCVRYKW